MLSLALLLALALMAPCLLIPVLADPAHARPCHVHFHGGLLETTWCEGSHQGPAQAEPGGARK